VELVRKLLPHLLGRHKKSKHLKKEIVCQVTVLTGLAHHLAISSGMTKKSFTTAQAAGAVFGVMLNETAQQANQAERRKAIALPRWRR
jgi:uncharacterized membrane protein